MANKRKPAPSGSNDSPTAKRPRPSDSLEEVDDEQSSSSPKIAHQLPRSDPIFGQKHAFPGLDEEVDGGELFYGPAEDGIEYLRMVRSEARTLPALFISQEKIIRDQKISDDVGDSAGVTTRDAGQQWVYSDGVYAAVSRAPQVPPPDAEEASADPQEIYYNLLHHRFLLLRSTLKCMPPASLMAALGSSHPITHPANSRRAREEWYGLLQRVEPQMVQLACIDTDSVLRILRGVARSLSGASKSGDWALVKRIGAWAWGLLGRCKEVGEMGSEEVGELRDLGKRSVKILTKIREDEAREEFLKSQESGGYGLNDEEDDWSEASGGEEDEGGEGQEEDLAKDVGNEEGGAVCEEPTESAPKDDDNGGVAGQGNGEEDLEAAKERLRVKLENQSKENETVQVDTIDNGVNTEDAHEQSSNDASNETNLRKETRAMLDMIITIVGEFYGQRDLLESRDIWEEDEEGW